MVRDKGMLNAADVCMLYVGKSSARTTSQVKISILNIDILGISKQKLIGILFLSIY